MRLLLLLLLSLSCVPAFAQNTSSNTYGRQQALTGQQARLGEVVMVRRVVIEDQRRMNAGTGIGAGVGGVVGNRAGSNSSRDRQRVATAAGAALGGIAGTSAGRAMTRRQGLEIYVRDISRRGQPIVTVVQDADMEVRPGDMVFLTGSGRNLRVVRADSAEW
ncbi:MAG: glycine zipper 2TM domain-containing protein [Lysobacteraceae bacterium]